LWGVRGGEDLELEKPSLMTNTWNNLERKIGRWTEPKAQKKRVRFGRGKNWGL